MFLTLTFMTRPAFNLPALKRRNHMSDKEGETLLQVYSYLTTKGLLARKWVLSFPAFVSQG